MLVANVQRRAASGEDVHVHDGALAAAPWDNTGRVTAAAAYASTTARA